MNLKQNKILTLAIIEEFNTESQYLTDDEDIANRLNAIYNACLTNIARLKKIERVYEFEDRTESATDLYEEFDMPDDCYLIRDIIIQDDETKSIKINQSDWYRLEDRIYINAKVKGTAILRYYAYPTEIDQNENDEDYEFEIDRDIQYLLPYAVASDILKSDRSVDYTAYENKYRTELTSLYLNKEEMQVFINTDNLI